MTCFSCSSGNYTGGMEFFTNAPKSSAPVPNPQYQPPPPHHYQPAPAPQQGGCSFRGQKCMYTAQGKLVCLQNEQSTSSIFEGFANPGDSTQCVMINITTPPGSMGTYSNVSVPNNPLATSPAITPVVAPVVTPAPAVTPRQLSFYSLDNGNGVVWKSYDYNLLLQRYPVGTKFVIIYSGKKFRLGFNTLQNPQIQSVTIEKTLDNGNTWIPAVAGDIPAQNQAQTGFPISIDEVMTSPATTTPASVATPAPVAVETTIPRQMSFYNIDLIGNTNKFYDYNTMLQKYPIGTYFLLRYKNVLFRLRFNAAENSQIRNTNFEKLDNNNKWVPATPADLPTAQAMGTPTAVDEIVIPPPAPIPVALSSNGPEPKTLKSADPLDTNLYNDSHTNRMLNGLIKARLLYASFDFAGAVQELGGFRNSYYVNAMDTRKDAMVSWHSAFINLPRVKPFYYARYPTPDPSVQPIPRQLSFFNVQQTGNINKFYDYNTMLQRYPIGTSFFITYNNILFRLRFNEAENSQIRNTTFEKTTDNGFSWIPALPSDLPTSQAMGTPTTVQEIVMLK